jgi:5-methylcytosine-specific restriction endonuclease McrA
MKRDYGDPSYKKFRTNVLKRDKFTCQMCSSKKRLNVHHIIKWSSASSLRFDASNGITLCNYCHKGISGKESVYVSYFNEIVRRNSNG